MSTKTTVALLGNPNCGKTTLFNRLTGTHQHVGNWPGVTVEKKYGYYTHAGKGYELVDLPGLYSMYGDQSDSLDQRIAQSYIAQQQADVLVNVLDASCLERSLYLCSQLLALGQRQIVVLNMMDVAAKQGTDVNAAALSERLGCPVVSLVASRGEGTETLLQAIDALHGVPARSGLSLDYPEDIADSISRLKQDFAKAEIDRVMANYAVEAALHGDHDALQILPVQLRERCAQILSVNSDVHVAAISARYGWATELAQQVSSSGAQSGTNFSAAIDKLVLHRWLAYPIFLLIMYLMFMFTINIGGAFIDVFDIVAGVVFVELPHSLFASLHFPAWLSTLLADGVGGGVQLVASFIPVIGALFLFQAFLEASGYMARAAFVMDRLMRAIGLPGKSFVPLIVGFGCNVPAVMSARTLETEQDRLLTVIMAPFMSCGARLTVYVLFASVFFPSNAHNIVFALYLIGIALAVLSGFALRTRAMRAPVSTFVMELPQYHWPTLSRVLVQAWHKLKGFVLRAGKAIVLVVVVLNFVNSLGTDGSFGNQDSEQSVLSVIGKQLTPLVEPMGVTEENWPATVGLFTGVFAKEVVVGTLDSLYGSLAAQSSEAAEAPSTAMRNIVAGLRTVPENLAALNQQWGDPLGLRMDDLGDMAAQGVSDDSSSLIASLFVTPYAAFAYMLFVLLYMPCVATLGAIYKEAGRYWAVFSAVWNTVLAYALAVIVYKASQLGLAPANSAGWMFAMLVLIALVYTLLIRSVRKELSNSALIPVVNI